MNQGPGSPKDAKDSKEALDMDQVYQLMTARASGRVTNEQVEQAVSQLLQQEHQKQKQQQHATTTTKSNSQQNIAIVSGNSHEPSHKKEDHNFQVIQDSENYDDEEPAAEEQSPPPTNKHATNNITMPPPPVSTTNSSSTRTHSRQDPEGKKQPTNTKKLDLSHYEHIPLGDQGAPMMIVFGDGHTPDPAAVAAALRGTRQSLLCAIQDARHVRRQEMAKMDHARRYNNGYNRVGFDDQQAQEWTADTLIKVQTGVQNRQTPCGFVVEDLVKLFPEEMNAYTKFEQMYEEQEKKQEAAAAAKVEEEGDDDPNAAEAEDNQIAMAEKEVLVGHLRERAQQLDWRTDRMYQKWYLKFSDLRTGGFLPPKNSYKKKSETQQTWEESVVAFKSNLRGSSARGSWAHLSFQEVRFLHWIGFSASGMSEEGEKAPENFLSPPDPETTRALGFLAYDMFGRIVETAIALRKGDSTDQQVGESSDQNIYELSEGEQLTEKDIDRALEHPEIRPASIFNLSLANSDHRQAAAQLYFGPGFEERVEMELEELVLQHQKEEKGEVQKKDEADMQTRKEEDALFERLVSQGPGKDKDIENLAAAVSQKRKAGGVPSTSTKKTKAALSTSTVLLGILALAFHKPATAFSWGHHSSSNGNGGDGSSSFDSSAIFNASEWYLKYDHYPAYCSIPDEMKTRTIPLLTSDKVGQSKLIQVSTIIRHGARTPWAAPTPNSTCWPGYGPSWDCNLTTWLSTPPVDDPTGGIFWMNKMYTALDDPEHNLRNEWGGTCQRGQLLSQGFVQELQNGEFLRDAYVYQGTEDATHDERMKLLNAKTIFTDLPTKIYYRSDDEQRTLMSGQVVLRGMLQAELDAFVTNNKQHPILDLHVADYPRDVMYANRAICPRLQELAGRYFKSSDYLTFSQSQEYLTLEAFKQAVLEGGKCDLDCLMTTICTDRVLHPAVNDYKGEDIGRDGDYYGPSSDSGFQRRNDSLPVDPDFYGEHRFQRLALQDALNVTQLYTSNNGEFAKASMGPLWNEIFYHIDAAMGKAGSSSDGQGPDPAKFSLFSGHDTTLMPLLASLNAWDTKDFWPPYASMMIVELHQINLDGGADQSIYGGGNFTFRLLYNGQVLTSRVPLCPKGEELCPISVLENHLKNWLVWDCSRKYPVSKPYVDSVSHAQEILQSEGGSLAVGFIALISFVAGMFFTTLVVCCCCSERGRRVVQVAAAKARTHRRPQHNLVGSGDDEDDGIIMSQQSYSDSNGHPDGEENHDDHDML